MWLLAIKAPNMHIFMQGFDMVVGQLTTKLKKQLLVLGNLPNLKYRTAAKIPPDSVYRCMQTMWSSALIQVSGMVLYMGVLLTLTSVTEFVSVTTS